ncbi:hypothetical protein [Streptomyces sp. NPDC093514]|uniref:hypothetical protein n=1 Tax=Streptomyces sp. NPDC093514 TaxID=3366039 RepID=UPI0038048CA6
MLSPDKRLAITAPFGQTWPDLAPGREGTADLGQMAAEQAEHFALSRLRSCLGLIAAPSFCPDNIWQCPVHRETITRALGSDLQRAALAQVRGARAHPTSDSSRVVLV